MSEEIIELTSSITKSMVKESSHIDHLDFISEKGEEQIVTKSSIIQTILEESERSGVVDLESSREYEININSKLEKYGIL